MVYTTPLRKEKNLAGLKKNVFVVIWNDSYLDPLSFWDLLWMPNQTILNTRKMSVDLQSQWINHIIFLPMFINKGYWICDQAPRIVILIFPERIICGWFMYLRHQGTQEIGAAGRINTCLSVALLHGNLHRKGIIQTGRSQWTPLHW